MSQDELYILLKVVVAGCLGGLIGIERELAKKPAGIRTHMFVAGTVLKSEKDHQVYYLTSAASTLFAAGIGITVALERYVLAVCLTILVILINSAVGGLEQKYLEKGKPETDNVHRSN